MATEEEMARESRCLGLLRAKRWPQGIRCPRCSADRWRLHAGAGPRVGAAGTGGRPKYRCLCCNRTFNDLTGTVFARSRLPLWKWFECARRLREGPATCAQLAARLRVKVATAWRMRAVLRRAFCDPALNAAFEEASP